MSKVVSLWGEEFSIPDTQVVAKKIIKKIKEQTEEQKLKSKKTPVKDKIELITRKVHHILGKYVENTQVIKTREELHDYITQAIEKNVIAIDTETNNSLDPLTCKIMGGCIYVPGQRNAYIPINHVNVDTGERLSWQLTENDLKEEFQRLEDTKTKILMHNASFDYQVIKCTCGITLTVYWDTMLGARILDENERAGLKGQYIAKIDSSIEKYSIEGLFSGLEYAIFDPDLFALYAATDAYMTYKLYEWQKARFELPENSKIFYIFKEIEMPLLPVTAEMELSGVCIDQEYAKRLNKKYNDQLSQLDIELEKELKALSPKIQEWRLTPEANKKISKVAKDGTESYGKSKSEQLEDPVNLGSPSQLAILIYDVLKLPSVDKKTPRGTGEDILKKLADKGFDLGKAILKKRGMEKLLNTFVEKLPRVVSPRDNRLHAHFQQAGTDCVTGDSMILTSTGVHSIKDIVGEVNNAEYSEFKFPLINEKNEVEYTSHKIKFEDVDTFRVNLPYGFELEGTSNHPIRVFEKNEVKWKKLEDVKVNDLVIISKQNHPFSQDYLATGFDQQMCSKTHCKGKSTKMPLYFDEDFAELLGMFHADGSLVNKSGSWKLTLHNEQPEVVDRWTYLCEKLFEETPQFIKKYSSVITGYYVRGLKLSQLTTYVSSGKRNKRIPSEILNSKDSVFNAYVKGLTLDSNNHLPKKDRIKIAIFNKEDAKACQLRFLAQGIVTSINKTPISNSEYEYYLTFKYESLEWFKSHVGTIQSEKLHNVFSKKDKNTFYFSDDNFLYLPVTSITKSKNTVYDFTLPETHSFISNGFISHNTGRFSSSDPNLQNIPSHAKDVRMMFSAAPGCKFVGADFSL